MIRNEKGEFGSKYILEQYTDLYNDYSTWIEPNTEKQTTCDRLQAGVRAWLSWCEENDVDPLAVEENDVRSYIVEGLSKYAETQYITKPLS